ncbi:MAG: 2-C-methyl-D-erythritol 2,4-cyclodiphosphate synthase [Candidatus Methylacidiphilales bacterium]|nr:2-C-methyl-D-erythritol 2,4-cyclodiphosphate synthase [Candidatus Methylacidiphilales bacterium]
MTNRVGIGYDVHPLVEGRRLFLGGVEFQYPKGLDGHSDADVLIHAIADALLGAIGGGDIGHHFPNTDERWRGVPSTVFLKEIRRHIDEKGAFIENIDASVIAEAPKIVKRIPEMIAAMADALSISPDRINLKATTNERLGFIGRGEGIAAMAVASVTCPATRPAAPVAPATAD